MNKIGTTETHYGNAIDILAGMVNEAFNLNPDAIRKRVNRREMTEQMVSADKYQLDERRRT
ncbi:MAG: hypothetical protein WCJ56_03305 [bacterium]